MIEIRGKKPIFGKNIFLLDDHTLIKIVANDCEYWQSLRVKNLHFINNPIEIYPLDLETSLDTGRDSLITLEYLNDYQTLRSIVPFTFDTNQLLLLMKKMFEYLKLMHESKVFHGDIHDSNIMIDGENNIKFIDMENGMIDKIVSEFSYWSNEYNDVSKIANQIARLDVSNMLYLFLVYLNQGDFNCMSFVPFDLKKLGLPRDIKYIFEYSIKDEKKINLGYYFLEEINYLLSIGYESPMLLTKNQH